MQDGKHVILCIDDDPDILDALKIVLEANDYHVVTAGSAEEGLKAYKQTPPDLIISDLMMEEIDSGTNFVKELKILGNKAPIYLLSSTGDDFNRNIDPASLGFTGVFQKPIDNEKLLSIVKKKLS